LQTKQNLLTHYVDEHQKIEKLVGSLEASGVGNLDELNDKATHLRQHIEKVNTEIRQFTFEGNVSELEAGVQSFKSQLIDILSTLPSNEERQFSRTSLTATEETITKMQSEMDTCNSRKRRIDQDIQHILEAKETKCPKCGFVWKEGVSEKELEKLQGFSKELQQRVDKAKKEFDAAQEFRDKIKEYSMQQSRLRSLAYSYPKAQNLFDWLMEDDRIYHNPSQYISMVDHWIADLHRHSRMWSLKQELEMIDKTIKSTEAMSEGGTNHISETMQELDTKTQTLTRELGEVRKDLDRLKEAVSLLDKRDAWAEELSSLLNQVEADKELQTVALKSEILGDLIRSHQSQLASKTHKLSEKKALEGIIADLETSLAEVEASHRANKLLASALSPTDGVIAQQMTAFIDCLVQQVNAVIADIYSYPLKVYPCGIGSGELDYKFPINAGNDMVDAKDISMGSEGQQEIIDFAFKLVTILYLGFNDYPLYLDELGSSQDETHLTNVMNYVKLLIESHRHSQLFMISHYAIGHGGFTNAEVLVLDGTNITVPGRHNDHAEFS
jgi:DNA repair exonuclease SbcCD ATPase subunit